MPLDHGAMIEPSAVGAHASARTDVRGKNVVVSGAGTIGNLVAQFCKARGANKVLITDVSDLRLEKARECGIEHTLNVTRGSLKDTVKEVFGDEGYQVGFEVAGVESSIRSLMETIEKGSDIVVVAVFAKDPVLSMFHLGEHELRLIGSMMYRHEDYVKAVDYVSRGIIKLEPLVSNRFAFEQYDDAYKFIDANRETSMKVIIDLEMPAIDFPTGVVKISLTEDGIPDYDICRNVAWDYIPFTPEMNQLAQSADAVCFGSLAQRCFVSRDCISRFLDIMRGNCNTLRVFDLNLRQDFYDCNIVGNSLHCCNVVKLNDEELPIVVRMFSIKGDSAKQQCRNLMERFGLKMAILTCGTRGSYIFAQDTTSFVETPLVEVADTVGAGDSFLGAFIGSLLNGKTIHDAHTTAVRISAYVCTQNGAMPDIPRSLTI